MQTVAAKLKLCQLCKAGSHGCNDFRCSCLNSLCHSEPWKFGGTGNLVFRKLKFASPQYFNGRKGFSLFLFTFPLATIAIGLMQLSREFANMTAHNPLASFGEFGIFFFTMGIFVANFRRNRKGTSSHGAQENPNTRTELS